MGDIYLPERYPIFSPLFTWARLPPLLSISCAFLIGDILGSLVPIPAIYGFGLLGLMLAAAGIGIFKIKRKPALIFVGLLIGACGLGVGRYLASFPVMNSDDFVAFYAGSSETVAVVGTVIVAPEVRDQYINLVVDAEILRLPGSVEHKDTRGKILAQITDFSKDWAYGDRVVITGKIMKPPLGESGSYREYLFRKGIFVMMPRARVGLLDTGQGQKALGLIYALKQRALSTIYQIYPDPEASLLAGILLGVETGISPELQTAFRDTGTSHIIAISGFNFTILAAVFVAVFQRWPGRTAGLICAVIAVGGYAVLVGGEAPVIRAAIMGGIGLAGRRLNRRTSVYTLLFFVAAVMAFFAPQVLWDIGFQLSFMATVGLVVFGNPFETGVVRFLTVYSDRNTALKIAAPVTEYFLMTLAAQITTLPLLVFYFKRVSLISFAANPIILPAQPPIMILGGLSVLIGIFFPVLGGYVGSLNFILLRFTVRVVELLAGFKWSSTVVSTEGWYWMVGFYFLIFLVVWGWPKLSPSQRWAWLGSPFFLTSGALIVVYFWGIALAKPDGRLHMVFMETGSGEAVLLQTPSGRYVLVDGGDSTVRLSDAMGQWLPVTHRALDCLVVANPSNDHIGAIPRLFEVYTPAELFWSGPTYSSTAAGMLLESAAKENISVEMLVSDQEIDLGQGVVLRLLGKGSSGGVFLLSWDRFRAMLPFGLDAELMDYLSAEEENLRQLSVLAAAENGLPSLNARDWVQKLEPQVILLNVPDGGRHGYLTPETLSNYDGYSLLRTDEVGWIHISTDGQQMWVETAR